jgi:hypothetical protein
VRLVVQQAYGIASADIFLVAAPIAFVAFLAVCFIHEIPLRTSNEDAATSPAA